MSEQQAPQEFHINIKSIRLTAFKTNLLIDPPVPQLTKINLQQNIKYELPDLIILTLNISFETPSGELFLEGTTQNVFILSELSSIIDKENRDLLHIPDNIIATLLSIAISHTRALISQNTLGSKFQDVLIPIVNPTQLLSNIPMIN